MKAFLIFMTFAISASYGQMNVHRLILTKEQNDSWISQLRAAPEDTRLSLVRDRLLLDTNVYVRTPLPDRLKVATDTGRIEAFARPFFIVTGKCDCLTLDIVNSTKSESIRQLVALLSEKNARVKDIFYGDRNIAALYGSRSVGGVILLSMRKRSICKKLRELTFE